MYFSWEIFSGTLAYILINANLASYTLVASNGTLAYVLTRASLESYTLVATKCFSSCMWAETEILCRSQLRLGCIWAATKIFPVACGLQVATKTSQLHMSRIWVFHGCTWVATEIFQLHVGCNWVFSNCTWGATTIFWSHVRCNRIFSVACGLQATQMVQLGFF
jgi:hypothetical protein